eukprot:8044383-Pyramimonas_sp.AAC.1
MAIGQNWRARSRWHAPAGRRLSVIYLGDIRNSFVRFAFAISASPENSLRTTLRSAQFAISTLEKPPDSQGPKFTNRRPWESGSVSKVEIANWADRDVVLKLFSGEAEIAKANLTKELRMSLL